MSEMTSSGRDHKERQLELCLADEGMWKSLPHEERIVLEVVMSANRLEEGLRLAPGQLPQSLVDGKELVLMLVSFFAQGCVVPV